MKAVAPGDGECSESKSARGERVRGGALVRSLIAPAKNVSRAKKVPRLA